MTPKVAVLSLTRDRLAYSKHCFASLRRNAGCDYDHYVLDQGSEDGTVDWLREETKAGRLCYFTYWGENIGISRGMNYLIDQARYVEEVRLAEHRAQQADHRRRRAPAPAYTHYVGFDNDCEVVRPGTLRTVCELAGQEWILSPRVDGLNNPCHRDDDNAVRLDGHRVGPTGVLGNIFRCVPARVYEEGYRYNENNPPWGGEETQICEWWAARGGKAGYLLDLAVNHYEGTEQQKRTYPEYWERKKQEMGIPG